MTLGNEKIGILFEVANFVRIEERGHSCLAQMKVILKESDWCIYSRALIDHSPSAKKPIFTVKNSAKD